ncbi:MAG: type I 3-dehydroquinate dehydratase [Candidatus Thermoplasmatota archaeon]|jgi:shikimate dehydrogenase/3-dehydroquinate dehydratase type I|nr:type I 3-dehydroquinate dehydratase [Candidatus Thermoplasmatota archaeon]
MRVLSLFYDDADAPHELINRFSDVDAVELRLDKIRSVEQVPDIRKITEMPVIATFRSTSESGFFTSTGIKRKKFIINALEKEYDYVDIEYKNDIEFINDFLKYNRKSKIIISMHRTKEINLSKIYNILKKIMVYDADFIKIVVPVKDTAMACELLSFSDMHYNKKITILSNKRCNGLMRAVAARDENKLSFGYAESYQSHSPAIPPITSIIKINKTTPFFGLIGWPLLYSLSPYFLKKIYRGRGIDVPYLLLPVKRKRSLGMVIENLHQLNFMGINVTTPYKEEVIQYLDMVDSIAEKTRSVSTVNLTNTLYGFNMDYHALKRILEDRVINGSRAIILGSGGASRTAIVLMKEFGYDVHVKSRNKNRLKKIMKEYDIKEDNGLPYDLIINGTVVGYSADKFPYRLPRIAKNGIAIDFVYKEKGDSPFVKAMKQDGCRNIVRGEELVAYHAILSFEKWFNAVLTKNEVNNVIANIANTKKENLHDYS